LNHRKPVLGSPVQVLVPPQINIGRRERHPPPRKNFYLLVRNMPYAMQLGEE